jgi:hypothetical protein
MYDNAVRAVVMMASGCMEWLAGMGLLFGSFVLVLNDLDRS